MADILSIIQSGINSLGMTRQDLANVEEMVQSANARRAPITDIGGKTVESVAQAGAGSLAAQDAGIDFMNIMANPEYMSTVLADRYSQAQEAQRQANTAVTQATSVGLLDNPLTWLVNQVKLPDLQAHAAATNVEADRIREEMVGRNNISQQFTATQQQNARLLTTKSVESTIAAMENQILNANIAMEVDELTRSTKTIAEISRLGIDQINMAVQADNIRWRREQAEQDRLDREAARKEKLDLVKKSKRAEEILRAAVRKGATQLGFTEMVNATDEQLDATILAMKQSKGGELTYDNLVSVGLSGRVGDSPADYAKNLLVTPINTDNLAKPRAQLTLQLQEEAAKVNGGAPIKNAEQAAALSAGVTKYLTEKTAEIKYVDNVADATNPFKAPPIRAMRDMDIVKKSPFLSTVAKEVVDSNGLDLSPQQIAARAKIYAANNPKAMPQLAKDIAAYYKTANKVTYAEVGGESMGLKPLDTYKVKLSVNRVALETPYQSAARFAGGGLLTGTANLALQGLMKDNKILDMTKEADVMKAILAQ